MSIELAGSSHSDRSVVAGADRLSEPFVTISCSLKRGPTLKKFRFVLLTLMLTASYFLEGARSFSSSRIDVRGAITRITRAGGDGRGKALARVLIEGAKDPDTQVDKAVVDVTAETEFFVKSDGKQRKPAEFAALKEGQRAEARFTGPVRESYPVQATAAEITILEE
jgi:hypothetical protein